MGRIPPQSGGRRLARCAWALALCLIGHGAPAAAPDVRVLVDISASMQASDPDNLRVPAVGALVERLPEGSRAGVWTFGRYVNMLVPYGEVDGAWRGAALDTVGAIDSVAVHADLESAIETATWNWTAPVAGGARHLLVITDGPIELPGGADQNRRSGERILTALLPRLRAADVRIHAVAFGPAIDGDLLHRLAAETGGRYRHTDAASLPALLGELLHRKIAPPPPHTARAPDPWTGTAPEPAETPAPSGYRTGTTPEPANAATPASSAETAPEAASAPAAAAGQPARDWTRIGLGVMIANLALGIGLLLAYRFLPRTAPSAAGTEAVSLVARGPDAEPEDDPGTAQGAGPEAEGARPSTAGGPGRRQETTTGSPTAGPNTPAMDLAVDPAPSSPGSADEDPADEGPPGTRASGGHDYGALEGMEIDGIDVDRIDLDFSESGPDTDPDTVTVAGDRWPEATDPPFAPLREDVRRAGANGP